MDMLMDKESVLVAVPTASVLEVASGGLGTTSFHSILLPLIHINLERKIGHIFIDPRIVINS